MPKGTGVVNGFSNIRNVTLEAAAVLPAGWTLAKLERNGSQWCAYATRSLGTEKWTSTFAVGNSECAARTAVGLQARAHDLEFPQ